MTSVKLYVYDLSNGMARQLSQQLTGRQIDGVWYGLCEGYPSPHPSDTILGILQWLYFQKKCSTAKASIQQLLGDRMQVSTTSMFRTDDLTFFQHGAPLQIIDMGETALDEDTFNDYLEEMRTHYTADKVCRCFQCLVS